MDQISICQVNSFNLDLLLGLFMAGGEDDWSRQPPVDPARTGGTGYTSLEAGRRWRREQDWRDNGYPDTLETGAWGKQPS